MIKTLSAKKNLRKSRRAYLRNLIFKKQLREKLKEVSAKTLPEVYSFIDKAAKRKIISQNKADRLKSKVQKSQSEIKVQPSTLKRRHKKKTKSMKKSAKK